MSLVLIRNRQPLLGTFVWGHPPCCLGTHRRGVWPSLMRKAGCAGHVGRGLTTKMQGRSYRSHCSAIVRRYFGSAHLIQTALFGLIALALPAQAEEGTTRLNSTLHEVLIDTVDDKPWLRFRYITPEISRETGTLSFAQAEPHMAHLCVTQALPYMAEHNLTADVIIISFADRITEFGVPDPQATQFFEAYRIKNQTCIWEGL